MKKHFIFRISHCTLIGLSILLTGCTVRTYSLTRYRVDQGLGIGNQGYLEGQVPAVEEKERKTTRTVQVVELEFGSPARSKKASKAAPEEKAEAPKTEIEKEYAPEISTTEVIKPEPAPLNFQKYTVQKSDSLQSISKKFYGTTKKWMKIYETNKDVLKSPDRIIPGQVLDIPIYPQEKVKPAKENIK
jgi:LysM repeat protein